MTRRPLPFVRDMSTAERHEVERSRGAAIQILIGPADEAPNFATRCFTLQPGGRIPCHRHDSIEHEQVMLSGEMVIALDEREHAAHTGDCIFIPAGVSHWYENRGDEPAVFLCMVPITAEYQTEWLEEPAN